MPQMMTDKRQSRFIEYLDILAFITIYCGLFRFHWSRACLRSLRSRSIDPGRVMQPSQQQQQLQREHICAYDGVFIHF